MDRQTDATAHDILEDTPLPHEIHAETVFRITGSLCPARIMRSKLGVQQAQLTNWLNWRKTPIARTHYAVMAELLGVSGRAILEADNPPASLKIIVDRIAKLGRCTSEHVYSLADYDGDPHSWENRIRLHELAIWAVYKYPLGDLAHLDWGTRDTWLTDDATARMHKTHAVVQVRMTQFMRPVNPFDLMAHYTDTDYVRVAVSPGVPTPTTKRETKAERARKNALHGVPAAGVSFSEAMDSGPVPADEDDEVMGEMLDELEEQVENAPPSKPGWDIAKYGPDPDKPFAARDGYDVLQERQLWIANQRN